MWVLQASESLVPNVLCLQVCGQVRSSCGHDGLQSSEAVTPNSTPPKLTAVIHSEARAVSTVLLSLVVIYVKYVK